MARTTRLAAASAGLCILLSGCSGQAGSTQAASPVASTAAAASPKPSPIGPATARPTPVTTPAPTVSFDTQAALEAPPGAVELLFTGDPLPRFAPELVSASSGTIALFLDNSKNRPQLAPDGTKNNIQTHNIQIGPSVGSPLVGSPSIPAGESLLFTVYDLPPGTYAFWCSVFDHYRIGMVGTLTITP